MRSLASLSLSLLYRPEPGDQVQSLSFIRIVSTDIISVQTTGFFALVISFFVIATNNHSSVKDHRNCVTQWNTCCEFGVSPTEGERGEYNKIIIIFKNKNFIGSLGQSPFYCGPLCRVIDRIMMWNQVPSTFILIYSHVGGPHSVTVTSFLEGAWVTTGECQEPT